MLFSQRRVTQTVTAAWRYRPYRRSARNVQTQAQYEYPPPEDPADSSIHAIPAGLATPRQLVRYLDDFVIGQENAKKVLSVAVFNHYNRVRANLAATRQDELDWGEPDSLSMEDSSQKVAPARVLPHPQRLHPSFPLQARHPFPLFEKSNVLVIGPTGSGKTLLAKTLAKVIDVPFSVSDATSFTQVDVGDDVDMCIQRLLQAASWDPYRASMGIVYIDEVDKIARKSGGSGMDSTRDVGGEGVQQALLRMMEGSVVTVPAKGGMAEAPMGGQGRRGPRGPNAGPPKSDSYSIDTSNVLFILSGAFVGLDSVIKRRVAKGSIGFTAQLSSTSSEESSNAFMHFFTPNKTSGSPNILDFVEPSDLVRYGFIPEFISRLPSITTLAPLTPQDLRRVLTDVKGSLISQYTALFLYSGVEIRFSSGALDEICRKAAERGGGARGLRGIMEQLLLEPMYEVPGSSVRHVLITERVVQGLDKPLYWGKGEGSALWAAWAEEEERRPGRGV
ncbi:uncharacterized protein PHACADRAFT_249313 [Phanerochaete carnosa HHB-10118-sp]|uniref:AAA+ ATPase domain-containing protein n=1 Tax=Phanerochaete carnosa (strain HHB-10118-sp) TaxID=650164 RepID=K5W5A6_PHACS|nr:uncharacterized protein PHACADRAFT_249313 [Phanerochaete carnosa HHB-10118-sp]EKM59098.1 hypothetical protein PHACADRAFT_249313 [Phanerochaete carnosa HHB-10118-sp]